jgi:5-methylcytosine-specific restriction endonuclease McrA
MPVKARTIRQRHPLPDVRASAQARGYDHSWTKLRNAFLQANPLCCAPGCNAAATVADHRIPIVVNPALRLTWENLRPFCTTHHNQATARFRTHGVNELPEVKQ